MGVSCSTHGRDEKYNFLSETPRRNETTWKPYGVDGMTILKWILKRKYFNVIYLAAVRYY
jgi:hypothetical protein